jgi:NAD(P)-dependent dehydrogenase (short-subunit alcohol dehydrogenase family)
MKGLKDKVVIVTGGASGIGRATAERLASEGSKVAIVDVDGQRAAEAAAAIGGATIGVAGDVSSEADVQRYFAEIKRHFGHIDALHNNAGVGGSYSQLVDLDLATIERLIAVNYLGVFLNLREMLRVARAADTPVTIVNTASITGQQPAPMLGAYGSTKAAVISLTRTAAFETARSGTRVNAVMPGPIETPMLERLNPEYYAAMRAAVPAGRLGKPEEVAAMAAFLLSDEAPFATGGVYPVDGGGPRSQPPA